MEIKEIRVHNLLLLAEKFGRNIVAERLGYSDTNYLNQLCSGHGSFGNATARKVEKAFGYSTGWMDNFHKSLDEPAKTTTNTQKDTDRYKLLLKLGQLIEDFSPAEVAELEAQVELIRRRKDGKF